VQQWLRDSPEKQPDSHSRLKQHAEPCDEAKLGLRVVPPEADPAETAEGKIQHEDEEHRSDEQVKPSETVDDLLHDRGEGASERLSKEDPGQHEDRRDADRDREDGAELRGRLAVGRPRRLLRTNISHSALPLPLTGPPPLATRTDPGDPSAVRGA